MGFLTVSQGVSMFSVVTGRLGSGKSLFVASLIEDAARRGKRIVANFDLDSKAQISIYLFFQKVFVIYTYDKHT